MDSLDEKKNTLEEVIDSYNLKNYKHGTSQPVLLLIRGNKRLFTDKLSRVIEIEQLIILLKYSLELSKDIINNLCAEMDKSETFNKELQLKKMMILCFQTEINKSIFHDTHLERTINYLGKEQKCFSLINNQDVEKQLGYVFIIFGYLNEKSQNCIIDKMAEMLSKEQIDYLDKDKKVERSVYFPEENGAWMQIEEVVRNYAKNDLKGKFGSLICKRTNPSNAGRIMHEVRKKQRYVIIKYSLPYHVDKSIREQFVNIYEKDWPEGSVIN